MTLDKKQSIALFRYSVIAPLETGTYDKGKSKNDFFRDAASKTYIDPEGKPKRISFHTIKKWHRYYKKDGFEGILFSGNRKKEKVVIVMSGSNGGMSLTEKEARFYQQNGIPALALALFKTKQTQKDLDRVPIEYNEKAIAYLHFHIYTSLCRSIISILKKFKEHPFFTTI